MRKQINKTEREHILLHLVADACKGTAIKAVKALAALRAELHQLMVENWQQSMPNVSRDDQLALLRSRCANSLSMSSLNLMKMVDGERTSSVEFCKVWWRNAGMSDTLKSRRSRFASEIAKRVPGFDVAVQDGVGTGWASHFCLERSFADIITGFLPKAVYAEGEELPKEACAKLNKALWGIHNRATTQLTVLKDLLDSAEDMYQDLGAAIAPVKTAVALAELMPEAVKHFPPSLTYEKPSKQLADPKAINDIRAKLKAGLPI